MEQAERATSGKKHTDEHMVGIHVMSGVSMTCHMTPFFGASNADARANVKNALTEKVMPHS